MTQTNYTRRVYWSRQSRRTIIIYIHSLNAVPSADNDPCVNWKARIQLESHNFQHNASNFCKAGPRLWGNKLSQCDFWNSSEHLTSVLSF